MKLCPTCNRSYTDETQKFCLDDGSTLVEGTSPSFDPQVTLAMQGGVSTAPLSSPGQSPYGASGGQGSHDADPGQQQQAGAWTPTPQRFTPVSTAAPKRTVLPWVLGGVAVAIVGLIGLIIVIAIAFSGSSNTNTNSNSNSNKRTSDHVVIRSRSGNVQVSVPPSWKSTTELNDNADLQVSDTPNALYLIVLTASKSSYSDVDMDIDKHASATLESLTKSMTYSNKTGPTKLTVDGSPALQYEIRGTAKGVSVVYLHTTVETGSNYHQIVSWTLQANYSKHEDLLKDIINSFKEI